MHRSSICSQKTEQSNNSHGYKRLLSSFIRVSKYKKTESRSPVNWFQHLTILYEPIAATKFIFKINHQKAYLQEGDLKNKIENVSKLETQRLDDVVPLKTSVSLKK